MKDKFKNLSHQEKQQFISNVKSDKEKCLPTLNKTKSTLINIVRDVFMYLIPFSILASLIQGIHIIPQFIKLAIALTILVQIIPLVQHLDKCRVFKTYSNGKITYKEYLKLQKSDELNRWIQSVQAEPYIKENKIVSNQELLNKNNQIENTLPHSSVSNEFSNLEK